MFWYQLIDRKITQACPPAQGPMPPLYWAVTRGPASWW